MAGSEVISQVVRRPPKIALLDEIGTNKSKHSQQF
jgi:hypothetical protein